MFSLTLNIQAGAVQAEFVRESIPGQKFREASPKNFKWHTFMFFKASFLRPFFHPSTQHWGIKLKAYGGLTTKISTNFISAL